MILLIKFTLKSNALPKTNKVSLQTSLERIPLNLSYIFILSVKFENLTIRFNVLIISFMLAKFQKDQRSIAVLLNKS